MDSGDDDDDDDVGDGGNNIDKSKKLNQSHLLRIRDQAVYICAALENAINLLYNDERDKMGNPWTWRSCCQDAVNKINKITNYNTIKNGRAVEGWYQRFRVNDRFIRPPVNDAMKEPPLFSILPSLKTKMINWICDHPEEVNVANLHSAMHDTLLEETYKDYVNVKETNEDDDCGPVYSYEDILEFSGLKTVYQITK